MAILGLGNTLPLAAEVAATLENDDDINATLIDAQQYSAMDGELLDVLATAIVWWSRWKMGSWKAAGVRR